MPAPTTFSLTLIPNFETVGVVLAFTPDVGWPANTMAVAVDLSVKGCWLPVHDGLLSPIAGVNEFWSKIFGLTEGETYSVRCRFTRTDSSTQQTLESKTIIASVTTRKSPSYVDTVANASVRDATCVFISPTGNDGNAGTYASPRKTPRFGAAILNSSKTILVFKDGVYGPGAGQGAYDFANDLHWQITNTVGAADNYFVCRPESPGGVTITGAKPITGLSWTKHATRVYYADFSAYMQTSATKNAPRWIRNTTTGNVLWIYGGLDSNSDTTNLGINSGTLDLEGFVIDWDLNRIYIRRAPGDPDAAPTDGLYECSARARSLRASGSHYWIYEGFKVEMFGEIYHTGSRYIAGYLDPGQATFPLRFSDCDNIVWRDFESICAAFRLEQVPVNFTFEDFSITMNNAAERLYNSAGGAWNANLNSYGHISANAAFAILADQAGDSLVMRRGRVEGCDSALVINNGDGNQWTRHADIYDVDFDWMTDDAIESDCTFLNNGAGKNLAVFFCEFNHCNNCLSLSPYSPGPLWFIANVGDDCAWFYWVKIGQSRDGDGSTNANGHKLLYNNTMYTTLVVSNGAHCLSFNGGFGNLRLYNNILRGSSPYYIRDNGTVPPLSDFQVPNELRTNAFYTPSPAANPFRLRNVEYPTEAQLVTAGAGDFIMGGNLYGINPFPNGLSGELASSMKGVATTIKGISSIAADADGRNIGLPGNLGAFARFSYLLPPVPVILADAITEELNNATFIKEFTAQRKYLPITDLKDMGDITVQVVPASELQTRVGRNHNSYEYGTDIGIQKHLAKGEGEDTAELDELMRLAEDIADFIGTKRELACCQWLRTERTVTYSPDGLDERRTLIAVVRVTHVQFR